MNRRSDPKPEEDGSPTEGAGRRASDDPENHFRTDHLLSNLKQRALSGGLITATTQAAKVILGLVSTVVMARLLLPADFGVVAMVSSVSMFLFIFRDAGLSAATIQSEKITQAQASNLFWVNAAVSGVMGLMVAALAPVIAWFYGDARLVQITLVFSFSFLIRGCAVQHRALLHRQMRYGLIGFVEVASMLCGLVTGVVLACLGFQYWSLIWMQLSMALSELLLAWLVSGWRPGLPSRRSGTKSLLGFGASLTLSSVLSRLAAGTDVILLGRFFGADALGYYSRAMALLVRPLQQFLNPIEKVFVSLLARLQNDHLAYRDAFLLVYNIIALVIFPFAGLMLGTAPILVLVVLGERWAEVIPIFQAFCFAALFMSLANAGKWLLITQGRSRHIVLAGVLNSSLTLVSYLIGLPHGPWGVALSFSLTGLLVCLPINYHIFGGVGPVSRGDLWRVFLSHLPLWIIVFGATSMTLQQVESAVNPFVGLCICCLVGLVATLGTVACIPSLRREALHLVGVVGRTLRKQTAGDSE